jgi:hypothetical protein
MNDKSEQRINVLKEYKFNVKKNNDIQILKKKMKKYVYFEPKGGLNDILSCIYKCLQYCIKNKRILLVNGLKSHYKINFSDYFEIPLNNIIIDITKIKNICSNNSFSIYPIIFQDKMIDILEGKINFHYDKNLCGWSYKNAKFELFDINITEDIIIHSCSGTGNGFNLFKEIVFTQNVMNICKERYKLLNVPYLGIQIRNTDLKCDYITFFNQHKQLINSFTEIYLATDNDNVLQFFREKGLHIKNFTTFPTDSIYKNGLHNTKIEPHTKFIDVICDIYILSLSNTLLSPSKGGFIKLVQDVMNNRYFDAVIYNSG